MIDGITYEMWVFLWGLFFLALGVGKYVADRLDEEGRKIEDEETQLDKEERELIK